MTEDQDKRLVNSLKILSQTSRILNQELRRGELISFILEEAVENTGADLVCLVLEENGISCRQVYIIAAHSKKRLDLHNSDIPPDQGVREKPEPVQIDGNDPWNKVFKRQLGQEYSCRLRIPLYSASETSGHIDFYSRTYPCFEDENQSEFLSAYCSIFALALENSVLSEYARKKAVENKMLIETSQMLANVLEQDEVLPAIAEALKTVVSYDGISIYLVRQDGNMEPIYWRGYDDDNCKDILMSKIGEGLVGWVAKNAQGLVVDDVNKDDRYICGRSTTRSELVVPIKLKDSVIGVFNIESDSPESYQKHDLDLLSTFAAKSAIVIERASLYRELVYKRQLDQEVSIARSIQKTFLPQKELDLKGYDLAGINISSRQVGGDYYDYIRIEDGQIGLVIADVVGKGIPASLIMASFRASLIAEIRNNYAIRAIMQKVNRLMCESLDRGNFVTAVYGVLDTRSRIFTYSNAGHNPPVLIRSNNEIVELSEGGLAFGFQDNATYNERPISLNENDILVFYTDGVTEALDSQNEPFETQRLIEVIKRNREKPADEIVKRISESVREYKAENFILDDLTLMILKASK